MLFGLPVAISSQRPKFNPCGGCSEMPYADCQPWRSGHRHHAGSEPASSAVAGP